jgi:hypothetical protein
MAESQNDSNGLVRRLIPIPHFNKYHPDPTPAALRWLIHNNTKGFRRCIVRRGRRVLIDEREYFKWIEDQN